MVVHPLKHHLVCPTHAIASSLRVQTNEAPAHGFSGGLLLYRRGILTTRFVLLFARIPKVLRLLDKEGEYTYVF